MPRSATLMQLIIAAANTWGLILLVRAARDRRGSLTCHRD